MPSEYTTIAAIREANIAAGEHFFDAAAIRFFNSRILPYVWRGAGASFFVSSAHPDGQSRRYTVRRFDHATGVIVAVGDFRAYSRREDAYDAARDAAVDSHSSILTGGGAQ